MQARVDPRDKGRWAKAANKAKAAGIIVADSRGCLTPWIVYTLNRAADAELGPAKTGATAAR